MKNLYLLLISLVSSTLFAQNYQTDIENAFNLYTMTKDSHDLDKIILQLEQESAGKENRYLSYWTAYAKYKKSLGKLESGKENPSHQKEGKKELTDAIKILSQVKHKTSEDYALLSILKNFSITYCSPVRVPFVSGEAQKDGNMALEMDDQNIRAYLALGIRDYYTPSTYGGGKKFEGYFKKAISYNDSYSTNPYDPSWGKNEAYYYLVRYYIKTDINKARATLIEGLTLFPDDRRLNNLR